MGDDNISRFTTRARYALMLARNEAQKVNADAVKPEHLLLAIFFSLLRVSSFWFLVSSFWFLGFKSVFHRLSAYGRRQPLRSAKSM